MNDTELMMLEQMSYLNEACSIAGVSAPQVAEETIGERLAVFDEVALKKLEAYSSEGQQWAAIIRYIKGNSNINKLVQGETFYDSNGTILATAYHYKNNASDCVVSFVGTITGECWFDNATGLGTSDTNVQKEALNYINSLPYNNIEVVGHSKGGNLAQYVTITSDKVSKCVSMNGQGFSQEFLDKYWAEIELKGGCITNYSLSTDFVHILLYPIPNAKQDYCTGDRVDSFGENHSANSFFQYETVNDSYGNTITVVNVDNSGNPVVINGQKENEMMTYLHQFTCFALNTMPIEDRIKMGDYIGNIMQLSFSTLPVVGSDGRVYKNPMEYALSDEEMFCKFIAYVIKYIENYNLTEEQVRALFSMLGFDSFVEKLDKIYEDNKYLCDTVLVGAEGILMFFLKNITDGDRDPLIEKILSFFSLEINGFEVGFEDIWIKIEKEYNNIPKIKHNANQNVHLKKGKTYKYTSEVYEMLRNSMDTLKMMSLPNVSNWKKYQSNTWFNALLVDMFISGIKQYNEKLSDIYSVGIAQIDETFRVIERLDSDCSTKIEELVSDINILVLSTK